MNQVDNIKNGDNQEEKIEYTQKKYYTVSGLIQKILEHSFIVNENSDYYIKLNEKIQKLFYHLLENSLDIKNFENSKKINNTFLSSYLTGFGFNPKLKINKDKIYGKIEKNLIIYLPILVQFIKRDIESKKINIISNESEEIINDYIKKILIYLLVYGDKIDYNLIRNILDKDINELENIKSEFLNNTYKLDNEEFEFNEKLKISDKLKPFEDYFVFSSAYRYSFKVAQDNIIKLEKKYRFKNDNEKKIIFNDYLSESLENEIKIGFLTLYDLFLKTIELNIELDIRLEKISNAFFKLFNFIYYLSEENIAFIEFKGSFNEQNYNNKILSKLFNGKFNLNNSNNIFLDFLEITKKRFENSLNYDFDKVKKQISSNKSKQTETPYKNSEFIDINTLDLEKLTLDKWENIDIDNRYDIFLTKIFVKNNNDENIKINEILNINSKNTNKYIEIFCELHGDDIKIVNNQINDIKTFINSGKTLEDFTKYDINNVLFLYQWWRFILFLNKYEGQHDIPFYKKHFSKKLTGLNDIIIKKLEENNLLYNNLDINPKGRLHNMSVENIGFKINGMFKSLSKGNINLDTLKFGKNKFSNYTKLYCQNDTSSYDDVKKYLDLGINTLIKILQLKTTFSNEEENEYVILIKDFLSIHNLGSLKENEKNSIAQLIEALKVVKEKLFYLNKMFNVAEKDSELISEIFDELLKKHGDKESGIGVAKNFGRAIIKLIKNYNGDFHKLGDLTRLRINGKSYDEVIFLFLEFIKIAKEGGKIINIGIEDRAGHLYSFARKESGYRDLKTIFTLKSGNVVEFQFHFTELHNKKLYGIEVDKKIKNKLKNELSLLTKDELYKFMTFYFNETGNIASIELLENISILENEEIKNDKIYIEILKDQISKSKNNLQINNISGDLLYKLRRNMNNNVQIINKLERLERILFEDAWSLIILDFLKNKGLIN